jgi:hypothetical protein
MKKPGFSGLWFDSIWIEETRFLDAMNNEQETVSDYPKFDRGDERVAIGHGAG